MTQDFVLSLARETVLITLLIAAPLLLASLVVGLSVSVFQATTQIQEPTLTFVPKIVAILLGMLVFGSWMLNRLLQFAGQIMVRLGTL